MNIVDLKLAEIVIDEGTQSRVRLDSDAVAEYAERYKASIVLPPLIVFSDGVKNWLADGFHRYHAGEAAGLELLPCRVREGTVDDARLYAAGANQSHGVRRTNADKRRAVELVLGNPSSAEWSDHAIAEHVGVSHTFVGTIRAQLETVSSCVEPPNRLGRDGKRRKVKPKPVASEPAPAPVDPAGATSAADKSGSAVAVEDEGPDEDYSFEETAFKKADAALGVIVRYFDAAWPDEAPHGGKQKRLIRVLDRALKTARTRIKQGGRN